MKVTGKQRGRSEVSEMTFLKRVKDCSTLDTICNEEIKGELEVNSILDDPEPYRNRWKEHVERLPIQRILEVVYKPAGQ